MSAIKRVILWRETQCIDIHISLNMTNSLSPDYLYMPRYLIVRQNVCYENKFSFPFS